MAQYAKYQIIQIPSAITRIGHADYPRPFLIVEVADPVMYVMAISTKIDTFFDENRDFYIDDMESGFDTTGLTETSFVKNQEFRVDSRLTLRVLGYLSGDILERFESFAHRFDL